MLNRNIITREVLEKVKFDYKDCYYIVGFILFRKYFYIKNQKFLEKFDPNQTIKFHNIDLSGLNINKEGFIYLIFSISRCSNIGELNLTNNEISENAFIN